MPATPRHRCPTTLGLGCTAAVLVLAACSGGPGTASAAGPTGSGSAAALPPVSSTSPPPVSSTATGLPDGIRGAGDGSGLMLAAHRLGDVTRVQGYDRSSGVVLRSQLLDAAFAFPVVAIDGPAEGVSFNGAAVVLQQTAGGRSRFAVLDARLGGPPRYLELTGAFSFDALAPDGGRLYLVEHLGPAGSEHYQVRSYDLAADRLDEAVIADKAKVAEWMAGHPTARVTSPDGAVVATMYERVGGEPFVHVLHADAAYAQCVDLPEAARGLRLVGTAAPSVLHLVDAAGAVRYRLDTGEATVAPAA